MTASSHGRPGGIPFGISILTLMLCIVGLLSAALFTVGWHSTRTLETTNVDLRMAALDQALSNWIVGGVRSSVVVQRALGRTPVFTRPHIGDADEEQVREMAALLRTSPNIAAAYIGYADGGFSYVGKTNLISASQKKELAVPPAAEFFTRTIHPARPGVEEYGFISGDGQRTFAAPRPSNYDPRLRPWYKEALAIRGPIMTEPYAFALTGTQGVSVATPTESGRGVIAFDFTLDQLSAVASQYKITPGSIVLVGTAAGNVLANSTLCATCRPADPSVVAFLREQLRAVTGTVNGRVSMRRTVGNTDWQVLIDPMPAVFTERFYMAAAVPVAEISSQSYRLLRQSAGIALVIIAVAALLVFAAALNLSRGIRRVAARTVAIRDLRLAEGSPIRSRIREITMLSESLESMRDGLQTFGRYVAKDLVRQIMRSPEAAGVGGVRRELTIMFTDIEGFARLSEDIAPELLTSRLSRYFDSLATPIAEHRGTIDKFIGDGIVAFWNAPEYNPDHVQDACRAALDAAAASRRLTDKWTTLGRPVFRTRIGLHTGSAVIGNVGARDRVNYTMVGAVANQASRLEALNKVYGTEILASGIVAETTRNQFLWRHVDSVVPAGTTEAMDVHELIARAPGTADALALLEIWRNVRRAYTDGAFPVAIEQIDAYLKIQPNDGPSLVLRERCRRFQESGPPPSWDGVWRYESK